MVPWKLPALADSNLHTVAHCGANRAPTARGRATGHPAQLPAAAGSKTRDKRIVNDAHVQVDCSGWLGCVVCRILWGFQTTLKSFPDTHSPGNQLDDLLS